MRQIHLLASVLALAALTGCLGIAEGPGTATPEPAASGEAAGEPEAVLVVEVTDPALVPIEGANLTLDTGEGPRQARTGADGTARLTELPEGPALLTVEAEDHRGRELRVDLDADQVHRRSVVLQPSPDGEAFVQRFEFEGFFECSASYMIVTGDCLAAPRAVSEQVGGPGFNATNSRYTFPFQIHRGWETIEIEQTWDEPTVGTGSTMRLNLEPRNPDETEGHSLQYAEADGTSPIELVVEKGKPHENASDGMVVPEEGGWLRTRTFHLGLSETHNPAGTEFLGTGVALQQHFTVVVEVRYG